MAGTFEKLLQPGRIGKLEIRNRIVMAPMGTGLAELDGRYSQRDIDYYAARGWGGAGLIITGFVKIETEIERIGPLPLAFGNADNLIPAMASLVDAVRDSEACIAMQISPGWGRQGRMADPKNPPVSASAVPTWLDPSVMCRPLRGEEIWAIIDACAAAAGRAQRAGFNAIEIHGHSGYLVDQFMSPVWNKREDEWGGDFDRRMKFPTEIIKGVRKIVGPDFPIIFRLSVDQKVPWGRRAEESQEIARRIEAAGADAIHADAGSYEAIDWIFPPNYLGDGCMLDMAAAIKKAVKIPVITVGNMTPELGEAALENGEADFVAWGRGLIADPDMPEKLRRGHREDVRPCLHCNEFCRSRTAVLKPINCTVNPAAANERYYEVRPARKVKRVVVIGGGPGGMEAARVAALRGHRVTLLEKREVLGGNFRAAAAPPFKIDLRRLIEWWQVQLRKLEVDVRLNTEVTIDTPELAEAEAIVVASGGSSIRPPIPGIDGDNVIDVLDHHFGRKAIRGDRIVIAGGGLSGCDAALELALEGKKVTIVEMLDGVARELNPTSKVTLMRQLKANGVELLTGHKVLRFGAEGVIAQNQEGQQITVEGDGVITAFGIRSENALAMEIKAKWPEVYIVGDCQKPSKVGEAIRAGFVAGWRI